MCVVDANTGLCTTSGAVNYYYGADGVRVAKWYGQWGGSGGSLLEEYVYDLEGHEISVHNSSGTIRNELYARNGRHVATWASSTLTMNFADWQGTERVRSNPGGTEICTDTPYGMNMTCSGLSDTSGMHYTGLQYDAETAMSHAQNRQLPMQLGRWLNADPGGLQAAKLDDPQTWNMYAYVRNNPMTLTDPTGLRGTVAQGGPPFCDAGTWDGCTQPSLAQSFAWNVVDEERDAEAAAWEMAQNTTPTIKGVAADCPGCTSEKKAAIAAEKAAIGQTRGAAKKGKYEEFGGWVITKNGKNFTYTVPVTFGSPEHFHQDNVTVPEGYAQVAVYHTHPDPNSMGEGLSPGDMGWANRNQMNIYVGMSYSGNVRQYVPGKTQNNGLNGVSGDLIYTVP